MKTLDRFKLLSDRFQLSTLNLDDAMRMYVNRLGVFAKKWNCQL